MTHPHSSTVCRKTKLLARVGVYGFWSEHADDSKSGTKL